MADWSVSEINKIMMRNDTNSFNLDPDYLEELKKYEDDFELEDMASKLSTPEKEGSSHPLVQRSLGGKHRESLDWRNVQI
mmetsp:Transcript_11853/g.20045  ORF Transcript_11853/g.20045 Transcript_11853/m.20045 type:complete len:80 (+) Transcript_11853:323-562(+)